MSVKPKLAVREDQGLILERQSSLVLGFTARCTRQASRFMEWPPPRHIINKMPKVKDKEIILKAAREKQLATGVYP